MSSDPPPETASIPESESTLSSRIDTPLADSVSSSSTLPEPISTTWQTQLNEARLGIARKVQQQQDEDGWEFPELEEEESELGENSGGDEPKGRRQSVVTTDGEDDEIVAELLRPGTSRANSQRDYSGKEEGSDPSIAEDGGDGREDGKAEERDMSNDRTCRICFDGEDDDLGKLFSPCRCRGTSRFVHTECLAAWRKASANSSSFYRCETCAFEYKFRRTFVGNVINSRFSVLTFTAFTFLILVWGSGFLANSLLSMVESRAHSLHGTVFDDFFVADHVLLGEGVRESLAFVTHQLEDSRWSSAREIAQQAHLQDPLEGDGSMYRWFGKSGKAAATIPTTQSGLADPGLWARAVLHMTKGISLLGLLSVFYTYIAATFVSPLGRTLFRAIRPAGGRRRAGDNSTSFSQIIIILVIAVGIARAMRQVYRGVRWSCRRALSRIEDLVIEVN